MSVFVNNGCAAPAVVCSRVPIKRALRCSVAPLGLFALLCAGATPSLGQTSPQVGNEPGSIGNGGASSGSKRAQANASGVPAAISRATNAANAKR